MDAATRELIAAVKLPTTHGHADGVAAGIVAGLEQLLREHAIAPQEIAFIAHSTTQATNALLEGDLARVGIVRVGGSFARWSMHFAPIPLGRAGSFAPVFYDAPGASADAAGLLDRMSADGVEAVAVTDAFSVDRPGREARLVEAARTRGFAATSGAEVSTMYGLRARTRTAAINAAILPRMLRTSRVTKSAVEAARIPAPLMIMRSDGGVMDVAEVERRPILTMLSGPAAGIAGALFHENVTDGIFIEVGGTSADCSVIKRGQPQMRPARIGGHRTLLRTLDVRTLAIAGGSLVHLHGTAVGDVGPRSAHIAGMAYAAFTPREVIAQCQASIEAGIAALAAPDGTRTALTPTCAANALDLVPQGAFARGDAAAAQMAFARVAFAVGTTGDALARAVLDIATEKLRAAIDELIADYTLDPATVAIVGGGGGAAALIPYAAQKLGYAFRLARDAEVISPLGVALALVRDVVERTIVDPTPEDLVRIRREAIDAAVAAGAAPDRVEVTVDIDRSRNRVRATASGATALVEGATSQATVSQDERCAIAATHLGAVAPQLGARAGTFSVYTATNAGKNSQSCVIDERGVVRAIVADAHVIAATTATLEPALNDAFDTYTRFGDVGRALPDVRLVYGARIADLSGVAEPAQAVAIAREELRGADPAEVLAIIVAPRHA
ncbi:MAG: hydantoinase/oxoprolinase family protein [Candidatus Velthaea sp.]